MPAFPRMNDAAKWQAEIGRMKAAGVRFDYVDFELEGVPVCVPVALDGTFTLRAGIGVDINTLLIDPDNYAVLRPYLGKVGTLKFYFNDPLGKPDYQFAKMRVVDVEPARTSAGAGGKPAVLAYRLFIADGRRVFVSPRGGIVSYGMLNDARTDPLVESGERAKPRTWSNIELLKFCILEMGLSGLCTLDAAFDQRPPRMNVKWLGNHAPTELQVILDEVGGVFCLQSDATVRIESIGNGSGIDESKPGVYPLEKLPEMDMRGDIVAFTSAPNAIIRTVTLTGPDPETFEFVGRDKDGIWKPVDDLSYFRPFSAEFAVQSPFIAMPGTPENEKWRPVVGEMLYYYIGLSGRAHQILTRTMTEPGAAGEIVVKAKTRVQHEDGLYYNSEEPVVIPVSYLVNAEPLPYGPGILRLGQRVGKVDAKWCPTEFPDTHFVAPVKGDMTVTYSHELLDSDVVGRPITNDQGAPRRLFFEVAFQMQNGEIRKLSPSETRNALANPDTICIRRPDWICYYNENNEAINGADLEKKAADLAAVYLAGSGKQPRKYLIVGWQQIELSGQISEISITQSPPQMLVSVNTWHMASAAAAARASWRGIDEKEAYAAQPRTGEDRLALGANASARPPAMLVGPSGDAKPAVNTRIWVRITSAVRVAGEPAPWRWNYRAVRVRKAHPGYGGWEEIIGSEHDCFNAAEEYNGATGILGNAVDVTDLPGTFAPKALVAGNHYPAEIVTAEGKIEYWVREPNAVDGNC